MNVPKLRFKDENKADYPEWEIGELKQFCQVNPKAENLPDEFIYIDLESVESGQLLKESLILLEDAPSRAQRLLQVNDVLFQMVRPYQQNNLFFDKVGQYVASTGYAQIRTTENPKFLYYCLHVQEFVSEVMNRCTGTSYPAINSADLETIEIAKPFIEEQQKIANFLSAVDDKITFLTAQKTALTQYKQGMMQRIFAQTLRFKDDNGADYPDWKIQPIGGYLIEYKEQSVKHGEFEVLTSSNRGLIRQRDYYGENRLTERDNEGFNVIPHGYITYRSRSDNSKFTFNLNLLGITGVISVYYPVFSIHNGDNRFWVEYLNFHWKDISIYSVGTSQKVLALSALRSIKMSLPTKNEQTKIAQFLTELDDKINAVGAQIQSAQQWKQGLLQQMFV